MKPATIFSLLTALALQVSASPIVIRGLDTPEIVVKLKNGAQVTKIHNQYKAPTKSVLAAAYLAESEEEKKYFVYDKNGKWKDEAKGILPPLAEADYAGVTAGQLVFTYLFIDAGATKMKVSLDSSPFGIVAIVVDEHVDSTEWTSGRPTGLMRQCTIERTGAIANNIKNPSSLSAQRKQEVFEVYSDKAFWDKKLVKPADGELAERIYVKAGNVNDQKEVRMGCQWSDE
jgi:hypothetical protein